MKGTNKDLESNDENVDDVIAHLVSIDNENTDQSSESDDEDNHLTSEAFVDHCAALRQGQQELLRGRIRHPEL